MVRNDPPPGDVSSIVSALPPPTFNDASALPASMVNDTSASPPSTVGDTSAIPQQATVDTTMTSPPEYQAPNDTANSVPTPSRTGYVQRIRPYPYGPALEANYVATVNGERVTFREVPEVSPIDEYLKGLRGTMTLILKFVAALLAISLVFELLRRTLL